MKNWQFCLLLSTLWLILGAISASLFTTLIAYIVALCFVLIAAIVSNSQT